MSDITRGLAPMEALALPAIQAWLSEQGFVLTGDGLATMLPVCEDCMSLLTPRHDGWWKCLRPLCGMAYSPVDVDLYRVVVEDAHTPDRTNQEATR